jgi:aspartyl-tRNA(Asn)/glutamyl-tRNA(Gln) amidotransferase subunit A
MTEAVRFSDWFALPQSERLAAADQCRKRLGIIGRKLHAVAAEFPAKPVPHGALSGFPYVAKDMIATGRGAPSWGCAQPVSDGKNTARVIARLDETGANLIGAAEMTELAYEPSGMNAARGCVNNPWNFDCVPGGSSSGSAALVASGCCFAALGSDTGGSVRIPAHCCGVTALKPTYGAVPSDGTMPLSPSLDTIGILARSARDIAALWPVVSGRKASGGMPMKATVMTETFAETSPEIAEICRAAVDVIATCDIALTQASGFPETADRNVLLVMQAEAARAHRDVIEDMRVDVVLRKRLAKGLTISDEALAEALSQRDALRREFITQYLTGGAVALLPVMPVATPFVRAVDPVSPEFNARTLYAMSRFTRFVNYLGLPSVALPAGFDSRGMPVGLQIVGRPDSDGALLALAAKFQERTDWHGRIPTAIRADIAAERELAA